MSMPRMVFWDLRVRKCPTPIARRMTFPRRVIRSLEEMLFFVDSVDMLKTNENIP